MSKRKKRDTIRGNQIEQWDVFFVCLYICGSIGIFLEKLLRGGKIEIFVSKGGHACVRVHAFQMLKGGHKIL